MADKTDADAFVPRGAVAFFIAMIALYLVMWFGMYFQVLGRIAQ